MAKLLALACVLSATVARADPEGYQGGDGRPPGTTFAPPDGPSMTVRRVMVATTVIDDHWTCAGGAMSPGTYDLVTVALELANPASQPLSAHLDSFDLVIGPDKKNVVEGACTRSTLVTSISLGPKKSRIVRERFLVPRGEVPEVLVYNNDDFPTLFALPTAKRPKAKHR